MSDDELIEQASDPVLRERFARVLHDANTGKICPDPDDPTSYGRMADAVLAEIAVLLAAGLLQHPTTPVVEVCGNKEPLSDLTCDQAARHDLHFNSKRRGTVWQVGEFICQCADEDTDPTPNSQQLQPTPKLGADGGARERPTAAEMNAALHEALQEDEQVLAEAEAEDALYDDLAGTPINDYSTWRRRSL